MRTLGLLLSFLAMLPLVACGGRYTSLEKPMSECNFRSVPFHEFNECMKSKLESTNSSGYYAKKNQEILDLLDTYEGLVEVNLFTDEKVAELFMDEVNRGIRQEQQSAKTAGTIVAVGLGVAAVAACANNGGCGGSSSSSYYYQNPYMCSACPGCSPVCDIGKACGNTCISIYDTCHVGRGTACNTYFRSYP